MSSKTQTSYTVKEAEQALKRYCAYRERCHKEVEEKLKKMNMIPDARDHIIYILLQENYLNEERFARSFARGKFRIKKWGKRRIISELKFRQISKRNIEFALTEIPTEEYYTTFDELAFKRLKQIKETQSQKIKKKLADYLLYRGWESSLVIEKVNEIVN